MKQFNSILLQAHWVEEGDFWTIGAGGYSSADAEPEAIETDPASLSKYYGLSDVIEQLKLIMELWLAQGISDSITILINGNEI